MLLHDALTGVRHVARLPAVRVKRLTLSGSPAMSSVNYAFLAFCLEEKSVIYLRGSDLTCHEKLYLSLIT